MRNLFKSKSGMSIVEVLMSITVLAIVSTMLFMGFFSVIAITKETDKQIDINAMTRIVKETFTSYVKNTGFGVRVYPNTAPSERVELYNGSVIKSSMSHIAIENVSADLVYEDYEYEYNLLEGQAGTPVVINGISDPYKDTYMFEIKIRKRDTTNVVRQLVIYINHINY